MRRSTLERIAHRKVESKTFHKRSRTRRPEGIRLCENYVSTGGDEERTLLRTITVVRNIEPDRTQRRDEPDPGPRGETNARCLEKVSDRLTLEYLARVDKERRPQVAAESGKCKTEFDVGNEQRVPAGGRSDDHRIHRTGPGIRLQLQQPHDWTEFVLREPAHHPDDREDHQDAERASRASRPEPR